MTVCTKTLRLAKPYNRAVDVAFDAPHTSSDGGLLLLRALDERLGVSATLGALVPDTRDARKVVNPRPRPVSGSPRPPQSGETRRHRHFAASAARRLTGSLPSNRSQSAGCGLCG